MPTVVLQPGATVFVTGVNGLIGSHIADQLLARGYNVRGAVRDVEKTKWLKEYFDDKHKSTSFELIAVPDMTVEGCYDDVVAGASGFIHVAAPVGTLSDLDTAIGLGKKAALNALKACAKTPSITRFVNTSSMYAATFPKPGLDHDFPVDKSTYNNDGLEQARDQGGADGSRSNTILVYAGMKTESERAMWRWVEENKPKFAFNSVVPYANFGSVLVPSQQGFPSTILWIRAAWSGEYWVEHSKSIPPQWFISVRDCALLHISALIHSDIDGERLFGFGARWNYNQVLAIFRKNYPEKKFPENLEGLGDDMVKAPTERAEEVVRWMKGSGWGGLEETLIETVKDW